jgi:peptidoglycan-N-acetylglucosamine deacetylase
MMEKINNHIAMSIDLDDWYHNPAITGSSFSIYKSVNEFFHDWKDPFDYITESTLKIIELFKTYNISATFFVIADQVERYPVIMKSLKNSQHEIACHSLHHQIPIDSKKKELIQSKEEWKNDLIQAKYILENYFEREIVGYRAPGAYFANWMVPYLEHCGFKYDSSISYNSLYNKTNVKLLNIPQNPYLLNSDDLSNCKPDSKIIEFPWSNYNFFGFRIPTAGAYFFRLLGYHFFKYVINQNLKYSDTMFYMHSFDISNFRVPLKIIKQRPFFWVNKGDRTLSKLQMMVEYYNELIISHYSLLNKIG